MAATCYFIKCLLSLFLFNGVLGSHVSSSYLAEKIQDLEKVVHRTSCQVYFARGYRYEHMYPVDGLIFDNVDVEMKFGELNRFLMHFAIKGSKDAIIILTPTANPGSDDLVFEIVVGIDFGLVTVLRTKKEGLINIDEVARVHTSHPIISPSTYTDFYISLDNDVLKFGKKASDPIITYFDVRLRQIKYFDMSCYGNYDAKFLFDCPAPYS